MFGRRDRIIRSLIRHRLLVFLRDNGGCFDGILLDTDTTTLRFADVHHRTNGASVPVQGEVFQDRAQVAYVQYVPAEQPPPAVA